LVGSGSTCDGSGGGGWAIGEMIFVLICMVVRLVDLLLSLTESVKQTISDKISPDSSKEEGGGEGLCVAVYLAIIYLLLNYANSTSSVRGPWIPSGFSDWGRNAK